MSTPFLLVLIETLTIGFLNIICNALNKNDNKCATQLLYTSIAIKPLTFTLK